MDFNIIDTVRVGKIILYVCEKFGIPFSRSELMRDIPQLYLREDDVFYCLQIDCSMHRELRLINEYFDIS